VFKYTATYTSLFSKEPKSEDLYFHLTAPELAKFNEKFEGGFQEYAKKILPSGDGVKILELFDSLASISYGRRLVEDGEELFIKRKTWTEAFLSSPAWEAMYLWLTNDIAGNNAAKFWTGMMSDALRVPAEKAAGKKLEEMTPEELMAFAQSQRDAQENKA
jgi:hypothetical protein